MTLLVLVILGVMWVVVLVPPLLRSRQDSRPSDSVVSFRRQLSTLQRTAPSRRSTPARVGFGAPRRVVTTPALRHERGLATSRAAVARTSRSAARRRRQNILFALTIAAGGTLLLAVTAGNRVVWYTHLVADVLLVGYVYLLVQRRKLHDQRVRTLRPVWSNAA